MTYLGLLFEIIMLVLAVYAYLFSIGKFSSSDPEIQKKAEIFRQQNGRWIKIGALLVIALMTIEILLHLRDIFS